MKIEFWEEMNTITTSIHDIDIKEFVEWLDGEEPSLELLQEYIYELWNPISCFDDYGDTIDSGFSNENVVNNFLKEVKNEQIR